MKTIPLTKGYVALIDDADFELVSKHKWYAWVDKNTVYAQTSILRDGSRKQIKLHRFIMGVTNPKVRVDHEDHNGLNNQRHNLRPCTQSQNGANMRKHRGTSKYKGVCWSKGAGKWTAQLGVNGRDVYLGLFTDELDAALAYDGAARQHFGAFACTNFQEVAA